MPHVTENTIINGSGIFFRDGRMLRWDDIYNCVIGATVGFPKDWLAEYNAAEAETNALTSLDHKP